MRRRCSMPSRRDGEPYLRHPHPPRPFAETARIKQATGAPVYAEGPHRASRPRFESEKHNPESGADRDFAPDIRIAHGDVVEGAGWRLEAVATPGHTANHLAFAWPERKFNFVGDHVMGWSTSIVAPPDGSMIDYMESLDRSPRARRICISPATARKSRTVRASCDS